jgi:hypothetical protein
MSSMHLLSQIPPSMSIANWCEPTQCRADRQGINNDGKLEAIVHYGPEYGFVTEPDAPYTPAGRLTVQLEEFNNSDRPHLDRRHPLLQVRFDRTGPVRPPATAATSSAWLRRTSSKRWTSRRHARTGTTDARRGARRRSRGVADLPLLVVRRSRQGTDDERPDSRPRQPTPSRSATGGREHPTR